MPGGFATADERWLAGLMVATPLASLWPPGGRLSLLGRRALMAAYAAAAAAALAAAVALRRELTAQARRPSWNSQLQLSVAVSVVPQL